MKIDDGMLDRLLNAVGRDYVPDDLDRGALGKAIEGSYEQSKLIAQWRSGPRARGRLKQVKRICKAAESLVSALKDSGDAFELIARVYQKDRSFSLEAAFDKRIAVKGPLAATIGRVPAVPKTVIPGTSRLAANINEFVILIQEIERSFELLAREFAAHGSWPTAAEWLGGAALPCVYEEHFHKSPGRSWGRDGKADGPCVRFIKATMTEMAVPYEPSSIIRTMTKWRPFQRRMAAYRALG